MIKDLDKETLKRLYLKEKKAIREIARISRCSPTRVRYRCIKYGIELRPNIWHKKNNLKKSVFMRLYVKEKKSTKEVAGILSCSPTTVITRCKEYDIPIRGQRVEGLTKPLLQKLYVKQGKTTREIAEIMGCSGEEIRIKCKKFGVPLRNPGIKKLEIDESTLRRLYRKEGKRMCEIAKLFNCSVAVISKRIRRLGLKKREGR